MQNQKKLKLLAPYDINGATGLFIGSGNYGNCFIFKGGKDADKVSLVAQDKERNCSTCGMGALRTIPDESLQCVLIGRGACPVIKKSKRSKAYKHLLDLATEDSYTKKCDIICFSDALFRLRELTKIKQAKKTLFKDMSKSYIPNLNPYSVYLTFNGVQWVYSTSSSYTLAANYRNGI